MLFPIALMVIGLLVMAAYLLGIRFSRKLAVGFGVVGGALMVLFVIAAIVLTAVGEGLGEGLIRPEINCCS